MITGLLLLIPLLAVPLVLLSGNKQAIRRNALIASFVQVAMTIWVISQFRNSGLAEMPFSLPWLPSIGVNLYLALDGISLLLVILTSVLIPIIIWSARNFESPKLNLFFALIFFSQFAMTGTFLVRDGIMFYIFWELALLPVYFLTALWGGENRIRITFKFFIYTLAGSLLMLAALIFLFYQTPAPHSFHFEELYKAALSKNVQYWIFGAFFIAFAIKIPLFPFHTWQPDTYTVAPAAGSMLLAGIMLKMGIYGIIRFILPLCPIALETLGFPILILIIVGILYASIIALRQDDLKRFVAYVSIAHVGLISAGVFTGNPLALQGAVIQMFSHGINVVGLFIVIDIIEQKTGCRQISGLGGLVGKLSKLSIFFMIIILGSIGLPLTNGFVGEYLLFMGIFVVQPWLALAAGLTIILGAFYMLRMYQQVMLGNTGTQIKSEFTDISVKDMFILVPIVLMNIGIGVYPQPMLDLIQPAIHQLLLK